ncbi:MAG: hypothetical protein BRC29_04075 [Nanohaloarchaea archaeon SW_7_43_1]|nr:MAG: hypothetical protein BRC29_04075 [Nanohaloarchaea archaeon SW_7_43_1]
MNPGHKNSEALINEILDYAPDSVLTSSEVKDLMESPKAGNQVEREIMSPYKFNEEVASEFLDYEESIFVPLDGQYAGDITDTPDTLEDLGGRVIVDYRSKQAAYIQRRNGAEGYRVVSFGDSLGVDQSIRRISFKFLEVEDDDPRIGESISYRSDDSGIIPELNQYDHEINTGLDKIE